MSTTIMGMSRVLVRDFFPILIEFYKNKSKEKTLPHSKHLDFLIASAEFTVFVEWYFRERYKNLELLFHDDRTKPELSLYYRDEEKEGWIFSLKLVETDIGTAGIVEMPPLNLSVHQQREFESMAGAIAKHFIQLPNGNYSLYIKPKKKEQ